MHRKPHLQWLASLEGKFEEQGITKSDFWSYVKRRYAVESRNDMTEMQWTQLSAELQAGALRARAFQGVGGADPATGRCGKNQ